jgi:tetratricopeptide (TPR) repeat protein
LAQLRQEHQDDPSLKSPEINLGMLFEEKGDLDSAALWLRKAIAQAPKDPQAQLELGACLLLQDRPDEAKACADAAARLNAQPRPLKLLRGRIALRTGDYGTLQGAIQGSRQRDP